jgi:hypothetical protein
MLLASIAEAVEAFLRFNRILSGSTLSPRRRKRIARASPDPIGASEDN